MKFLWNLVPWYWRWSAIVALILACVAFGFVKGLALEGAHRDQLEAKREARGRIVVRQINLETYRLEKFYFRAQERRVQLARTVAMEVTAHASLPDPVSCYLEPERVRNINAAWGLGQPGADPTGTDGALSLDPAPHLWITPGGGTVGNRSWRRLFGLFGPAPGADRPGAHARTGAGDRPQAMSESSSGSSSSSNGSSESSGDTTQ